MPIDITNYSHRFNQVVKGRKRATIKLKECYILITNYQMANLNSTRHQDSTGHQYRNYIILIRQKRKLISNAESIGYVKFVDFVKSRLITGSIVFLLPLKNANYQPV